MSDVAQTQLRASSTGEIKNVNVEFILQTEDYSQKCQ